VKVSRIRKSAGAVALAVVAVVISGCASQRPAPVVDRSGATPAVRPSSTVEKPAIPLVREARDGVYSVQRGDTLYSIALAFGVNVGDLARWNGLPDSSILAPGQQIRVIPPAEPTVATVTPVTPAGSTEVRPLPAPGGTAAPAPLPPVGVPGAAPEVAPAADSSGIPWQWPTQGNVIDGFDAPRNKGIDIGGNEGAAVHAAADGEVVHVGSALRGYGNLVIIRHQGEFVTAYGHNRKILVQQGQQVKRGQQIAELGRTDADRPKLHFEIRHQGKPLDPVKYLPPR
jgi:lipoprotein NlpD